MSGLGFEGWYVLAVLAGSLVLLVSEKVGMDVVGLGAIAALVVGGVLPAEDAIEGFGNPAVITIALLFAISEGLIRTGAVEFLSRQLIRFAGAEPGRLFLVSILAVALVSGFINNTPVVVVFVPIVLGLAERTGVSPSKFLLPISFASILGGTCTLIGTSTNLAIDGWIRHHGDDHGLAPLGLFEFTSFGLIYAGSGLLFLFFLGPRLLPDRRTVSSALGAGRHKEYLTELSIAPGSSLAGQPLDQVLGPARGIRVLQLLRGEDVLWPPFGGVSLEEEDVLLVKAPPTQVLDLVQREGMAKPAQEDGPAIEAKTTEISLAEVVITPDSRFVGRSLQEVKFHRLTGCHVLALQRHGAHLREKLSDLALAVGDLLLVEGDPRRIQELRGSPDFLLVAGAGEITLNVRRAPIASVVFLAIVLLASLQVHPALNVLTLSMAGAAILVGTGTISGRQAYRAIHWPVLVLIAGMIALARAMTETGVDLLLAGSISHWLASGGPWFALLGVFVLTSGLSQVLNNAAIALLMISIAVQLAHGLEVDPKPFVMAVIFGASACFATPFGYQTNAIVYGPGGYRVRDYVRIGLPLNLLLTAVAVVFIPLFWPF